MGLKNKKRNRPPETAESFRRRVERRAQRDIRNIADCDDAAVDALRGVGRWSGVEIEYICGSRGHGSLHAKVRRSCALSSDPDDLDGYSEEFFMVNRSQELPPTCVGRYTFVEGQLTFVNAHIIP